MLPYQLKCSESGLELTCAGRLEPRVPWTRASELLPLRDVTQPLVWAHIAKPPLHGSIKNAEKAQHSLNKVINLANVKPFTSGKEGRLRHRRNEELKYRIGLDINDPYGRESWYSGSCIKVEGDLVFFTGNDGFLRVSRMAEDDRGVFDDTPGIEVKIPHRKLDFERILSLHTSEETSSGSYHVAARRRHGLSVYSVTEADQVRRGPSLPCSQGVAASCWLGEDLVTVSGNSELDTWDLEYETVVSRVELNEARGSLTWGWADLAAGHHPRSVLVAERTEVRTVDTRSGAGARLELGLCWKDHVRAVDNDREGGPHCYVMSDEKLLLCDLRQTRGPVLTRHTAVGTWSPAANFCRRRIDDRDWVVMGDRWGDMKVCVMDWTHDTCATWRPESDRVTLRCVDTCPRVQGDVTHVGSWRETVRRGRGLCGDWLDPPVEQRVGLRFTGYEVIKERSGNIAILAVNVMGDLFGKKLTTHEMMDEEAYEDDTDDWLESWGQSVVRRSHLPLLKLYQRSFKMKNPRKPKYPSISKNLLTIPIASKDEKWQKRHKAKISYYKKLLKSEKLGTKTDAQGKSPSKKTKLEDGDNQEETQSVNETDLSKREDVFAASKVRSSKKERMVGSHPIPRFPSVVIADWPEQFVDTKEIQSTVRSMKTYPAKFLNIVSADKALTEFYKNYTSSTCRQDLSRLDRAKLHLEEPLKDHPVRNCLKSDWTSSVKSEAPDHVRTFTSYVDRKRTEKDKEGPNVLLPQFDKLNIGDYDEESNSKRMNVHSAKILKIMLGDLDSRIGEETFSVTSGPVSRGSSLVEGGGPSSDAEGPPQVEDDPSYAMDNFWADLGLDMPPSASSQADRRLSTVSTEKQKQEDDKDVDLSDLNLGDEDDFEL